MATLTISITTGATTSQTMTFSGPDATRIMNAYKAKIDPNGDQAGLTSWIAQNIKERLVLVVGQAETTTPVAPTIS